MIAVAMCYEDVRRRADAFDPCGDAPVWAMVIGGSISTAFVALTKRRREWSMRRSPFGARSVSERDGSETNTRKRVCWVSPWNRLLRG
jgi:hypothetical protein